MISSVHPQSDQPRFQDRDEKIDIPFSVGVRWCTSYPARVRETENVGRRPSVDELGLIIRNVDVVAVLGEGGNE